MANNADSFHWCPDAIAMLRKYWAANASGETIAGRINAEFRAGITRNAVIGKAHRLGLQKPAADVHRARSDSGRVHGKKNGEHLPGVRFTPSQQQKAVRTRKANVAIAREEKRLAEGIQPDPRGPVAPPKLAIVIPERHKPSQPPIPAVHVSTITGAIIPGPDPIPPRPMPEPEPEPLRADAQPITIEALTSRTCCWPLWKADDREDRRYCGDVRDPRSGAGHDRGYCTAHYRRSRSGKAA